MSNIGGLEDDSMSEINIYQSPRKESIAKVVESIPALPVISEIERKDRREAERLEAELRQKESLEQIRSHISSELSEMKNSLNKDQVCEYIYMI